MSTNKEEIDIIDEAINEAQRTCRAHLCELVNLYRAKRDLDDGIPARWNGEPFTDATLANILDGSDFGTRLELSCDLSDWRAEVAGRGVIAGVAQILLAGGGPTVQLCARVRVEHQLAMLDDDEDLEILIRCSCNQVASGWVEVAASDSIEIAALRWYASEHLNA